MKKRLNKRRGQAISEFVVGIFGITIAFFGLLQIAELGVGNNNRDGNIQNLKDARAEAEQKALNPIVSLSESDIETWDVGDDGLRYTADDEDDKLGFDPLDRLKQELEDPTSIPELMEETSDYDSVSERLEQSTVWSISLQSGDESTVVNIEPLLQNFVFENLKSIRIKDKAYMPSLDLGNPANLP